jgi:membrane protease YdiL (CAAX protease family)
MYTHGGLVVQPSFVPVTLISLLAGSFIEEIVFRGFLLNTMLKRMNVWLAVIIDAVLFTLLHYPIWIYLGIDFSENLWGVSIVPVSMLFAFSFIKTKNILVPGVLHIIYNLSIVLFVGN